MTTALPSIVLMYHRLGSPLVRSIVRGQYVLPALFRWQLELLLARGYMPTTLSDALAHPASGRVAVTFDDGYASVGKLAWPILRQFGIPATIFMVAGAVGKTNAWDVRDSDRVEPLLTADELRDMATAGIEIGAHTVTHAHLPRLTDAELRAELVDAKAKLEDILGHPVTSFAYPYGEWDARVRDAVIAAGYQRACATTRGVVRANTDPFAIPRLNMRWNTAGPLLLRKIRKAERE